MFRNLLSGLFGVCAIINQDDSDTSVSKMLPSKHSTRVVKNVDARPCLGCYEVGVQTRASLARSRSPDGYPERSVRSRSAKSSSSVSRAEDLLSPPSNRSNAGILVHHTCSSASTRRHRSTVTPSVHFETSSSWKETQPTHRYNLRSSPSWDEQLNEQPRFEEPTSRANSANAASWMYDDDPGDYYELDENSNLIPKAGMVSTMKRSYEERIERQSMPVTPSRSGTYLLTKERIDRPSMMDASSRSASYWHARERLNPFQYYLLKLSILWWQLIDYLTHDLFNYYNRVRIGGMLLVLLMVLVAHAVLHNVLITEDHQEQIAAMARSLFRLFPPQNWSAIPAQIGSKVLDVF